MSNASTYYDILSKSRALYGLGAVGAGTAIGMHAGFGETVGGGTALCVGLPLALKGAKGLVWDAPIWAYKNYGNYGDAFKTAASNWKETNFGSAVKAQRNFFINGVKGNGFLGGFRNAYNLTTLQELERAIPTDVSTGFSKSKYFKLRAENSEEAAEYLKKFQEAKKAKVAKVEIYKQAKEKVKAIKEGIKNGSLKGKDLQKAVSELDKAIAEADKTALSINVKPTSRLGKIQAGLSKYSGAKAINRALTKGAASESLAVRGASKAVKGFVKGGGALTAAIEFGVDTYENWEVYKNGTTSEKLEQAGKSATVAVASGAGYVAGAWAGGKLGAVVGTCIGGPIGTVVGGAIGMACGLAASFGCSYLAKLAVGDSVKNKKLAKDAEDKAIEAFNDPKKRQELIDDYDKMINGRDQMVQESVDEEQTTCPQDNTYIAPNDLDRQLAGLHFNYNS